MKTAVITGANRGIGKEIVRQLSQSGFRVILTARDMEKASRAARETGENVVPIELDVTSAGSVEAFGILLRDQTPQVDVLVNNAGILGSRRLLHFDMEEISQVMETNFFGALRVTQAVLPLMPKDPSSRIINVSSGMGAWKELSGGYAAYRLSKVSLNAFTVMLASELRQSGIRVNAMCPGWVRTEMGGAGATRSVERGAETVLWLATQPDVPTGMFFRDRRVIEW